MNENKINPKILKTFEYNRKDLSAGKIPDQLVKYETYEFSAVCPHSGMPDIGYLCVEYIPDKVILELKSFKLYLFSFRNVGIFQEHAIQKIFSDLEKLLKPKYLKVVLKYNIRGGIETTCEMEN
jgi:7-cyano-7-deazaguanine reductase